jgi:agmatinase
MTHHTPADSSKTPRFTGVRTFMRLPLVQTLDGADVAVVGIPTDGAVSFRSGARFGPEAIRSASVLLRPYNPHLDVDIVERLSMVDFGDAPTVPGYHLESLERIEHHLRPVHEAGVVPLCLGGDHSMVLAELRAAAAVHGPLALVHLDAHADVWDQYYGVEHFHGTIFRRAVEEGLVDPARSVQAGMRGTLYGASDVQAPRDLGFDALYMHELSALGPRAYGERVRARVGDTPVFLSFDIDFVDPAFAPGRARRRSAGRRAARRWPTCARSPASTSGEWTASRSRRPTTRPHHPVGRGERLPRDALAARAALGTRGRLTRAGARQCSEVRSPPGAGCAGRGQAPRVPLLAGDGGRRRT